MATISSRTNKNGKKVWRLMIRRKGIKSFITTFKTKREALKFAKENEEKYVLSPETFTYDHLRKRREREFE